MTYKQRKPLSEGIRVEQPNEESFHPIRQKNLDRNFQPMGDLNGGYYLRKKTNKPQDNSHVAGIDADINNLMDLPDDAFIQAYDYYHDQ